MFILFSTFDDLSLLSAKKRLMWTLASFAPSALSCEVLSGLHSWSDGLGQCAAKQLSLPVIRTREENAAFFAAVRSQGDADGNDPLQPSGWWLALKADPSSSNGEWRWTYNTTYDMSVDPIVSQAWGPAKGQCTVAADYYMNSARDSMESPPATGPAHVASLSQCCGSWHSVPINSSLTQRVACCSLSEPVAGGTLANSTAPSLKVGEAVAKAKGASGSTLTELEVALAKDSPRYSGAPAFASAGEAGGTLFGITPESLGCAEVHPTVKFDNSGFGARKLEKRFLRSRQRRRTTRSLAHDSADPHTFTWLQANASCAATGKTLPLLKAPWENAML